MKIIGSINEKGGVGKTTIIVNVCGDLASRGYKVALVDAEPQESATQIAQSEKLNYKVLAWGERDYENVEVLQEVKRSIKALEKDFDFVGIDTEPGFHGSAVLAAALSDLTIIPIGASSLDVWATTRTIDFIHSAQEDQGGNPLVLIVPNRIQPNTIMSRDLLSMLPEYGKVSEPVYLRVELAEAATAGQWVGDYAPKGKGKEEINKVTDSILGEISND